ncbi:hypothetical protein H5410_047302 [Solanum commersonii]|uniref:DUF1985 domain-containing protein n=2 Tax=Solanum commersonii TaxID=4109 RepID=A0A9J5XHW4_SOLCO|nr:hypothetical protein H5410_047302 [Solanum commersonii]
MKKMKQGEKKREQQEEKIIENEEKEKLEEEGLATDVAEVEKEVDVMGIVTKHNDEYNMAKTRGGIIKRSGSSAESSDDVESSNDKSDSEDESSRDTQTGDEDEDSLSLPICARDISIKLYDLKTWIDEIRSFSAKNYVRARMTGSKLNKEQKLKCSFVLFVDTMLLAHDRSKVVDSSHIKMVDDLDFFNSYSWGKKSFNLTLTYLKNKINLKKQSKVFNERGNTSDARMDFLGIFWIYEAFPHLEKYAKKSLDSPLPIPHLLIWHIVKNDNFIEGDPFKYKVVHPYLTPTVHETKNSYLATLKPYMDKVKDTILNALKANLKSVSVLISTRENVEDEYLSDHNPNQPYENSVPSTSKDENLYTNLAVDDDNFSTPTVDDEILSLAIVDDDLDAVDEYFAEEVDEVIEEMKEEELKEEEKEQYDRKRRGEAGGEQ